MFPARRLQQGGAGVLKRKCVKKQNQTTKFCSSGTFQVIIKQVCYTNVQQENVFKGKHDHIFVQKAQSSRSPL